MRVLVVDDDRDLLDLMQFALKRAGLEAILASDGPSALRLLETEAPDAVVLDVNLGAWNGFDLLTQIRRRTATPVIMLTALDREDDKIRGLELGADDYLTKPFSHRELVARLRAVRRRHGHDDPVQPPLPDVLEVGPLRMDLREHVVTKNGQPVSLTVTEFRVLNVLLGSAGRVVPTRDLLKRVWGYDDPGGGDTVRVVVWRLRRKLEDDPAKPRLLHTVPGVGVLVKADGAPDPAATDL